LRVLHQLIEIVHQFNANNKKGRTRGRP